MSTADLDGKLNIGDEGNLSTRNIYWAPVSTRQSAGNPKKGLGPNFCP